ncbi:DUF6470 family protein [Sporolactobacillus spathodeae]|uniref:Uncharacterized protein n=1 Tax=Sporolactobacillus spathodeae TaxID=1465502 RepID=A0ABS2Q657_9BACL|nr:DUF6470 family protein [Sporolactobacillus spathodeae]MBM7657258.1 hypothetical protein [Sporolactobacillus spathodeae]
MGSMTPHLEMHQVFGQIKIATQNATQSIRQPKAEQSIEQPKAKMTITRQPAIIAIDQSAGWNNMDLKSASVRIREAAEAGSQAVLDGIARRAEEGQQLLQLGKNKGQNMFARFAADHVADAVIGTRYSTGTTPASEAVRYQVTPAELSVNWQTFQPQVSAVTHAPEINVSPGQVDVSMARYPSLDIQAVGLYVDQRG